MSVASHILAGFSQTEVSPLVRDLILKHKVLGFTLFSRNIESATQLKELTGELKALARQAGYELLLAVDQEGGRVARLPRPYTQIEPMQEFGRRFLTTKDTKEVYELGKLLGREVSDGGFDLNFAPVVDVDINPNNPIIGNRSFSSDPLVVATLSAFLIRGMIEERIEPCLKHFPGHGATTKDSHKELPLDNRSLEELWKTDLIPYQQLIQNGLAQSIMTAHVLYPQIDPDYPATLSKIIIHDLLRKTMGYEGIIYSDDFLMKAIYDHYDLAEAAKRFFEIGGDVVLICDQPEATLEVIQKLKKYSF